MAWGEDEAIGPDVASAGLHISDQIDRDAATLPDLEARATRLTPTPRTPRK
jgi:nuclear pore complex protein Nup155